MVTASGEAYCRRISCNVVHEVSRRNPLMRSFIKHLILSLIQNSPGHCFLSYSLGDKNKFYQQPLHHLGTIHAGSLKSSTVLLSSALPLAKANKLAISLTCTHRPPAAKRKACVDRFSFCREGPVGLHTAQKPATLAVSAKCGGPHYGKICPCSCTASLGNY